MLAIHEFGLNKAIGGIRNKFVLYLMQWDNFQTLGQDEKKFY